MGEGVSGVVPEAPEGELVEAVVLLLHVVLRRLHVRVGDVLAVAIVVLYVSH